MDTKVGHKNLDALIADFIGIYPDLDYFTQENILQYIEMAYTIGFDDRKLIDYGGRSYPVKRSDGKVFNSIADAARFHGVNEITIRRKIKKGKKLDGFMFKVT